MPAHDRDRKVEEEARYFCSNKSSYPGPCLHHEPTLEELKESTFSDFIRDVVLRKAEPGYDEASESGNNGKHLRPLRHSTKDRPKPFRHGMAKISLPKGFCKQAIDPTGRGPDWDVGTHLGDMVVASPIKQCLRGIGGIYEFTFLDQCAMSVADFRKAADVYQASQLGTQADSLSIELLERKFWKRLTPTMQPAMYGADMDGTLFGDEDCHGWNISRLSSCLELLLSDLPDNHEGGIPGVTTPYLYFGMWASVFCAHTEDMNLLSINYLHAGAPKVWYAIAAGEDSRRLEQLCEGHYHQSKTVCPEYLRHKRCLISPIILKKAGIPFTTTVQYPGDAMITFPGSYHFGFNTGFNVAEATNFAVPEWVPYGKVANVCLCRPDSVRIDMNKFERLLLQYEREVKQTKRLTWREWAYRLRKKRKEKEERLDASPNKGEKTSESRQNGSRKAFWVELTQAVANRKTYAKKSRKKGKRGKHVGEIWHLAKPGGRKSLRQDARVLSIMPGEIDDDVPEDSSAEEEEYCFAGTIVEVRDEHVRVHLDGMPKKHDVWISVDSPKLYLDGGRWGETGEDEKLLPRHYWDEADSKRRCK